MKLLRFASIVYLLTFSFFLLASPLSAKSGCDTVSSQYNGPQFYLPGDDQARDCSTPSLERQIQELETSGVVCMDNPSLVSQAINQKLRDNLNFFPTKSLTGNSSLELVAYDGFGLDNQKVASLPDELTNYIGRAISIPDQYDPTLGDALCVYNNILTPNECNKYLNNLTPSGKSNYLGNAGFIRTSSTRETQFNQKKIRAQEIVSCAQNQEDPLTACDAPYLANKVTGDTSIDFAKELLALPNYNAFQQLPPQDQFRLLSLRESKALSAVYIVVRKKTGVINSLFFELVTSPEGFLTNYIPSVHQATKGSQYVYDLNSRKNAAADGAERINQKLRIPLSPSANIEALVNQKIDNSNIICPSFVYQSTGSHANYPEGTDRSINISLNFNVLKDWKDAINRQIDQTYEAYLVSPTALISQYVGEDDNAPLAKQFKREYQSAFQTPTFLPHDLTQSPPKVSTGNQTVDLPDGSTISGEIIYSARNNVQAPQPAGLVGDTSLFVKGKNAWKKNSSQHYSTTCYAAETLQKISQRFSSLGLSVFDALGVSAQTYSQSNCRPDPTAQTNPTNPGKCVQALFEKGLCPGGTDCVDYICDRASANNLNCGLLVMIAANESGGLFSCAQDLSSIKHFGCDPWGNAGFGNTIEEKLNCAINTLKKSTNLEDSLHNYGYSSVNDLPWGMFGLSPTSTLQASNNSAVLQQLQTEIYSGDPNRWWAAYCNRFPKLIEESGQTANPEDYACDR